MCYGTGCHYEDAYGICNAPRYARRCDDTYRDTMDCASCANQRDWSIQPEEDYEQSPCSTCKNMSNYKEAMR